MRQTIADASRPAAADSGGRPRFSSTCIGIARETVALAAFRKWGHDPHVVATVTNINDAKSKAGYFIAEGYYAKDSPEHRKGSAWFGKAAALLRLGRTVAPTTFERVLQGFLPGTGIRLGRIRDKKHEHRPGIEITLSAPKSVSIEGLVFGNNGVIEAHDEAVRATLAFVEREELETRVYNRDEKRMARVRADGMVAALFRHLASRNADPQLHTHALVANAQPAARTANGAA